MGYIQTALKNTTSLQQLQAVPKAFRKASAMDFPLLFALNKARPATLKSPLWIKTPLLEKYANATQSLVGACCYWAIFSLTGFPSRPSTARLRPIFQFCIFDTKRGSFSPNELFHAYFLRYGNCAKSQQMKHSSTSQLNLLSLSNLFPLTLLHTYPFFFGSSLVTFQMKRLNEVGNWKLKENRQFKRQTYWMVKSHKESKRDFKGTQSVFCWQKYRGT